MDAIIGQILRCSIDFHPSPPFCMGEVCPTNNSLGDRVTQFEDRANGIVQKDGNFAIFRPNPKFLIELRSSNSAIFRYVDQELGVRSSARTGDSLICSQFAAPSLVNDKRASH